MIAIILFSICLIILFAGWTWIGYRVGFNNGKKLGYDKALAFWVASYAKEFREYGKENGSSYYDGYFDAEKLWQNTYDISVARDVARRKAGAEEWDPKMLVDKSKRWSA